MIRKTWAGARSWSRDMPESESGVDSMSWSGSWEFGSLWAKSWPSFICFCSVWSKVERWTRPKSESWGDDI